MRDGCSSWQMSNQSRAVPQHILDADPIRVSNVADAGKLPLALHQHQIDLALADAHRRRTESSGDRRASRYSTLSSATEDAVVERLRGDFAKADEALALIGRLRHIGVGNLANTADDCLRRQTELFADGTIKQILQAKLAGLASI
jgi:hypothetical protein